MKNTIVIGVICIAVLAAGLWLYLHPNALSPKASTENASASTEQPKTTETAFKELTHGDTAKEITARKNYAIYDAAQFATFWKEAHGEGKPPVVDFSKNYVIGVFAGTEPSNGYSIAVSKVTDTAGARAVSVLITQPDANCSVVEEPTSPYQFVTVSYSDSEALSHTDTVVKKNCSN
jgi:hypothetical protein